MTSKILGYAVGSNAYLKEATRIVFGKRQRTLMEATAIRLLVKAVRHGTNQHIARAKALCRENVKSVENIELVALICGELTVEHASEETCRRYRSLMKESH